VNGHTDAELLAAVRAGDKHAYAALWDRHSPAARRYAHRLAPTRADDLVSEAFLAIYQQVTTTDAGPQFAFRSYLKTVIRNISIRWSKDAEQVIVTDELDAVDERDALTIAETDSAASDVLTALQALPERWQRVLWLAEVAEAGRPEIARELKIKPNAVSALQRRARTGLKFQWLNLQIPASLRDDESHAARLFPQYLTEPTNLAVSAEVTQHVADCTPCRALLHDTHGAAARMGSSTLAVLLGTAGIGTATATLSSATTATAIAVAAGAGAVTWLVGGGLAAVTAGTLVITSLFTVGPADAAADPSQQQPSSPTIPYDQGLPTRDPFSETDNAVSPGTGTPPATGAPTGRFVDDPTIQDAGLSNDPETQFVVTPPDRPAPAGPDVPGPGTTSPTDPTNPQPGDTLSPGVTTPTSSSTYLSPKITGTTTPGDSVAVQLDGQRYTPVVAPDGTWAFDTRTLQLQPGDYTYQAWAYSATQQSPAFEGAFTVLPLEVKGFENVTGYQDMLVPEAQTTGLVVEFQGPADGRVYLSSMEGHTAVVTLDSSGFARRRLLMNSWGWYYFTFRALDSDDFFGPGTEHALDVYDPDIIMDPWGPNPDDMTFELVDP